MMTTFWLAAAALVVLALAFLLPPLLRKKSVVASGHAEINVTLYREQFAELERDLQKGTLTAEQYEESRQELQRRLLEDVPQQDNPVTVSVLSKRPLAAGLLVLLPLAAVLLYLKLGAPQSLEPQQMAAPGMGAAGHAGADAQQFEQLINKLATRLRDQNPDDGAGWELLGRSYTSVGRFAEAANAYERAIKLAPPQAQLLADYADALAMVNGRRFDGKPAELIKQALAVDPSNLKALMLAGSEAFVRKDFASATTHWEKALQQLPPDSDEAREIMSGITEARNQVAPGARAATDLNSAAKLDNLSEIPVKPQATTGATVSGEVTLNPALSGKVAPTDKVRVFARAASGPKMPLAIVEAQVKDLPLKFTLTDAMAMMPEMKLSGFLEIVVVARVTKSGNAQAQSGDLQGMSGTLKVGTKDIRITIDTVVP